MGIDCTLEQIFESKVLYSEVLLGLFSKDINDVINILNRSIYYTNLSKSNDEIFILHTGFSFLTHKEKEMEVFIGISKKFNDITIIRQTRANWTQKLIPLINGIFIDIPAPNNYLNTVSKNHCFKVKQCNGDYNLLHNEYESIEEVLALNVKGLIESKGCFIIETSKENLEFPWSKTLKQKIFFDGTKFSKWVENDAGDDFESRQSLEDYLRNDYGDDAESAYWNID